uniref:Uncharacterized protein n=1 Tax=Pseudo-nitzschia australis TaxID=44445 RepID=A0A7S4ALF3_9STRA|mmetsp:Transcript_23700/g.51828  ORF Transcript_23700/g.51828 Transcript_23700/m.51828 type:complete len:287 (+) Transcript_23700:117-977(+)
MGRFTSVQIVSDSHTNNRTLTYEQAKGGSKQEDGKSSDNGSGSSKGNKLVTEKVVNPYGSTSGAGSGEFHVYRHARARELARWNALDEESKREEEERKFRATLAEDQKATETKASKNRKKRQREKEAKRRKKHMKAAGIDMNTNTNVNMNSNTTGSIDRRDTTRRGNDNYNDEEEFSYIPVAQKKQEAAIAERSSSSSLSPSEAPNNDPTIPNDGSFLEMMKRKLQEQEQLKDANDSNSSNSNQNSRDKTDEPGKPLGEAKVAIDDGEESEEEGPALPRTMSSMTK